MPAFILFHVLFVNQKTRYNYIKVYLSTTVNKHFLQRIESGKSFPNPLSVTHSDA